jgi:hypothetical protein
MYPLGRAFQPLSLIQAFARSWLMQRRARPRAGTMPLTGRAHRVAVYPPVTRDDFYMTMQRP